MVIEVRKITEARKHERELVVDWQARQALALEQIADVLEALRGEFVGLSHLVALLGKK